MKNRIEITESAIDKFNSDMHDYAIMYYDPKYGTVWTELDPSNYGNHEPQVYAIAYHGTRTRKTITRREIYRIINSHEADPLWEIEDELEGR